MDDHNPQPAQMVTPTEINDHGGAHPAKTEHFNHRNQTEAVGPRDTLRPFRLLRDDICNLQRRYLSDWTLFNQQIVASSVYVFFTNILPGITFASDLYALTGKSWGTIEVVFSTGLCGVVFAV